MTLPCRRSPWIKLAFLLGIALLGIVNGRAARSEAALCATPEQRRLISKLYESQPVAPPLVIEQSLHVPEQVVISALPSDRAALTSGEHLDPIWQSMSRWRGAAIFVISRNGTVLKFRSAVPATQPSPPPRPPTAGLYVVGQGAQSADGLEAQFPVDRVAAIGAISLQAATSATRAVLLFDAAGQPIVGVYASLGDADQSAERAADFERTWALLRSLPALCAPAT
jgi:putative heme iron utilization protein